MRIVSMIFVIALSVPALSDPGLAGDAVTVLRVIDGDTIRVWDPRGREAVIRLVGVDTPETRLDDKAARTARQWRVPVGEVIAAGEAAQAYVTGLIPPGSTVRLEPDGRGLDDYGRTLAYVFAATGQCVNELLVREGYARVYHRERYRERARYRELETAAREQRRGFWKTIWQSMKE